jgi:hypothetical protein
MSHKLTGGKNLAYIMDALWATDWELDKPIKWKMRPFNNGFTSSLFVSLDPVAIESVGYDFLRSEFPASSGADASVQMPGVDDYLHQAADSANWPSGIKYDPNNDGTYIASLGVHEHWNNATAKKYTRDLRTGMGIELIEIEQTSPVEVADHENRPEDFQLSQNYPNPFNPSTTISYSLSKNGEVKLEVFNLRGQKIATLVDGVKAAGNYEVTWSAENFASGVYFCRLQANQTSTTLAGRQISSFTQTKKLILLR